LCSNSFMIESWGFLYQTSGHDCITVKRGEYRAEGEDGSVCLSVPCKPPWPDDDARALASCTLSSLSTRRSQQDAAGASTNKATGASRVSGSCNYQSILYSIVAIAWGCNVLLPLLPWTNCEMNKEQQRGAGGVNAPFSRTES